VPSDASGLDGRRIAIVLGTSTGGIGRHVRSLVIGLRARHAAVTVCAPQPVDDGFGLTQLGATFVPVPIGKGWRFFDPRVVRRLREALSDVDLVHAHGLRPSIAAAATRETRRPLVLTWHNAVLGSAAHRRVLARGERLAARRADLVLGASQDLVDRALELGARDARPTLLPAPVLPPPSASRDAIRRSLGIGDEPVVLTVARLVPQKRLHLLVDAAGELAGDGVELSVLVVGDGRLRGELEERIRERRAPMRLLGARNDVGDLLAGADVFALSSAWEARSFAVQEAMLSGCPVVVPAVGGLTELVGNCGVLVEPNDAHSLAAGLRQLVVDADRRSALARAARARAATWPDEATVIDETVAAYLSLLNAAETSSAH